MILAHQPAFRPDESSQTLARLSRSDPGRFCTIWPIPSLEKTELKRMRDDDDEVMLDVFRCQLTY